MKDVPEAPRFPCRWKHEGKDYSQDCNFYELAVLQVEMKGGRITDLEISLLNSPRDKQWGIEEWAKADKNGRFKTYPDEYNIWVTVNRKLIHV